MKKNKGFTLIEILVVIGIIAILAAVVLVAINPARQFAQARNSQRQSNVETILNGYGQRLADNKGVFTGTGCSADIPSTAVDAASAVVMGNGTGQYDIRGCLVPIYVSALPYDPTAGAACNPSETTCTTYNTGYKIYKDANGRVTVFAPAGQTGGSDTAAAALGQTLSVTR